MEEYTTSQIVDFLEQNEIFQLTPTFSGFLREDLENFADVAQITTVKKGDTVFSKGDNANSIILILQGEVGIITEEAGETTEVASIPEASFVGEMGIIDQSPRGATVIARKDCLLANIPSQEFWLYFKLYPVLAINLVKTLNRRFKGGHPRKEHV